MNQPSEAFAQEALNHAMRAADRAAVAAQKHAPQPGLLAWGRYVPCQVEIYADDPFSSRGKRGGLTQVSVHESVTCDGDVLEDEEGERDDTTERVLRRKGLGVHFMIGALDESQAVVVQHNDLADVLYHTGKPVNDLSVGIEIINPYYNPADLWQRSIPAPWAHKGRYVLPLACQLEALFGLYQALAFGAQESTRLSRRLQIGADIWGVSQKGNFALGALPKSSPRSAPGLLAHVHYGHHADGGFPVLYCALRARGFEAAEAYELAVDLATGAKARVALPTRSASAPRTEA